MSARGPAKAATDDVGPLRLGLPRSLTFWGGNVRDARVRSIGPFPAKKITSTLSVKVVVRQRVPGTKRGVIITDSWDIIIVCINAILRYRRLSDVFRTTTRHGSD